MSEKKYGTVVTNQGAALIADCILTGKKLPITEAAAGDGGGAYYEPTADQTALKGECWRGEIAGVALSAYSPNMIDIKVVIDDAVGGFTVREMGLFTGDGVLFAVCNTPDTEKVSITGGIPGRLTMTMHIIVADASVVEVVINPTLDTVTSEQLEQRIAKHNADEHSHPDIRALALSSTRKDIIIPTTGWTESEEISALSIDVIVDGITENMFPIVTYNPEFDSIAAACELNARAKTGSGYIRLFAETALQQPIDAAVILLSPSANFSGGGSPLQPATKDRIGGVIIGDGVAVTSEGKISVATEDISATDADADDIINSIFGN